MIFPWHDLVTMRAALVHRSARYTEQTEGETVRVELDGTAIASLLAPGASAMIPATHSSRRDRSR
jgi:hypothetical protein